MNGKMLYFIRKAKEAMSDGPTFSEQFKKYTDSVNLKETKETKIYRKKTYKVITSISNLIKKYSNSGSYFCTYQMEIDVDRFKIIDFFRKKPMGFKVKYNEHSKKLIICWF